MARARPFKVEWETALLRRSHLPLPACAVLLAFATYADADGTSIRVSQPTVAEGLGTTERTVRKWLGVGREAGWIERTRESVGTGRADHYRLTIPEQTTGTIVPVLGSSEDSTTGTIVPVLGSDHRNDRAELPERTCTTTGTIVHDHRNDRSAYQPSTNPVTNPVTNPASNSQADSFDGDDSRPAVEAESLAPLASPQATAGEDPWAGIETDDGGTQEEWLSQQAVLAGSFSPNPEDPWAGVG